MYAVETCSMFYLSDLPQFVILLYFSTIPEFGGI